MTLHHCFPPVTTANTRLLLLGSLPGALSLAQQHYYANPRNQFWRLIGTVIGRDLMAMDYEPRLDALREAGVGLWDTVAAATRDGSLDSAIRLHQASDLAALAASLPSLRAIAFNGGKAATIGRRQLGDYQGPDLVDLPSSSPAFTLPFEVKRKSWLALRRYLAPS
jgi:TDG/mug DNA glycosylase family protein